MVIVKDVQISNSVVTNKYIVASEDISEHQPIRLETMDLVSYQRNLVLKMVPFFFVGYISGSFSLDTF